MVWIEIKVQTTSDNATPLSDVLTELGALAVTTEDAGDQPLYEPDPEMAPLWDEVIITGLFDENINQRIILSVITQKYPWLTPKIKQVDDKDWERAWMDDFKPMRFGERLWIIPSHEAQTIQPNQVALDPGLAFGTGKHPTTALCLQWLDQYIHHNEMVIDYGCGSGILGIAALKLGAQKVYAIDHDPQAIIATRSNAEKNKLNDQQIVTLYPNQLPLNLLPDILIANILANPLIDLAATFSKLLPSKSKIVLSGVLAEQAKNVVTAYQDDFEIIRVEQLEDWVRIDGYKI